MSKAPISPRVVVAEDEPDVLNMIAINLENAGFSVVRASDGEKALAEVRSAPPALVLLDLMMPRMDGLDVCRALKTDPATRDIPVIMLTARAEEVDRIVGLELGADDYVTKPFSPRELILRVKSVLRRSSPATAEEKPLRIGQIFVNPSTHEVRIGNKQVDLTATEYRLLTLLMERRGRVQSRDALLNEVWGYTSAMDTRTVDTHIRRLREKLGSCADYVETVRGFGYRMIAEQ